jgi:hypothetical protein
MCVCCLLNYKCVWIVEKPRLVWRRKRQPIDCACVQAMTTTFAHGYEEDDVELICCFKQNQWQSVSWMCPTRFHMHMRWNSSISLDVIIKFYDALIFQQPLWKTIRTDGHILLNMYIDIARCTYTHMHKSSNIEVKRENSTTCCLLK